MARSVDVFEVFSPRRVGPWHVLRPLFRGKALLAVAGLVVIGAFLLHTAHHPVAAVALVAVMAVLFVASFRATWFVLGLLIRARAELVVTAVVLVAEIELRSITTPIWADVILFGVLGGLLAVAPTRRFLVGRFWCVIDRHRLRACLRQTKVRTMNMDGSLPLMLWARPTKTGERVWLWIRAGSSGDDIEDALEYIAPACYAREARVHKVRKLSTIVAIEILRRDPLSKPNAVKSALARYVTKLINDGDVEGTERLRPATVTDITSTPVEDTVTQTAPKPRKAATTAPVIPAQAASVDDYSDYIDA